MRDSGQSDAEREWLRAPGHRVLHRGDDGFPELLSQIPGPPDSLWVDGDADVLQLPALAIVGSRNPTQGGARNAFEFDTGIERNL